MPRPWLYPPNAPRKYGRLPKPALLLSEKCDRADFSFPHSDPFLGGSGEVGNVLLMGGLGWEWPASPSLCRLLYAKVAGNARAL